MMRACPPRPPGEHAGRGGERVAVGPVAGPHPATLPGHPVSASLLNAARGLRDRELLEVVSGCESETAAQLAWLKTRLKSTAPQALIVAS